MVTYKPVGADELGAFPPRVMARLQAEFGGSGGGSGTASGFTTLTGPGIDPEGVLDSTTAIQAKINSSGMFGGDVYANGTYVLTGTLNMTMPGQRLYGPGVLKWTSGIATADAITVTADRVTIENIEMRNPNLLRNNITSGYNVGIRLTGNHCRVLNTVIDSFQSGILESASGEFTGGYIHGNKVLNVLGAGEGPVDTSAVPNDVGEDRGDGITSWGRSTIITDNYVTAAPGSDCRIGIHVESLATRHDAGQALADKFAVVSGNIVEGKFRRGIACESVHGTIIDGNVVEGSTWWGISAVVNAHDCHITNNHVYWTRTAEDDQGSSASPVRAPIEVAYDGRNALVQGNTVRLMAGSECRAGMVVYGDSVRKPDEVRFLDNTIVIEAGAIASEGIYAGGFVETVEVRGNRILGNVTQYGIQGGPSTRMDITDNYIDGGDGWTTGNVKGIVMSGGSAGNVCGNTVTNYAKAIERYGADNARVTDNDTGNCATGLDCGTATYLLVANNNLTGNATPYTGPANGTSGMVVVDNLGYRSPGGVINVKEHPYNAKGDGLTDDTAAIQAAITAAGTSSGNFDVYVPRGNYLTSGTLTGVNGLRLRGAGKTVANFTVATTAVNTTLLNTTSRTNTLVEGIGFVATGNTAIRSAVYANTTGTQKNLTVRDCKFTDFMPGVLTTTHAAIYAWTADGVTVTDNEIVGCGRAITIDQPDGFATVARNRITAPLLSNIMGTGIYVRRSSSLSEGRVKITGNYVQGADNDPSNIGTEGHGISVYRVRDVEITNNHCWNNGRGILVSYQSFGATIANNHCVGNYDSGIRVEPEITGFNTTVGTDVVRGLVVQGNICRNNAPRTDKPVGGGNYGIGLEISYAAAASVSGNICHDNAHTGLHCDSDRVTLSHNICFNNGKGSTANSTGATGIYLNDGSGCIIIGNQCFDNQTVKTQSYGLWLNNTSHLVGFNNLTGNGTAKTGGPGGIAANPGTATGTDAAVINSLVTTLRNLGLVT